MHQIFLGKMFFREKRISKAQKKSLKIGSCTSDEINHAEELCGKKRFLPENVLTYLTVISTNTSIWTCHYATFNSDMPPLNTALLGELSARLPWCSLSLFLYVFLFVSSLLQTTLKLFSFNGANECRRHARLCMWIGIFKFSTCNSQVNFLLGKKLPKNQDFLSSLMLFAILSRSHNAIFFK